MGSGLMTGADPSREEVDQFGRGWSRIHISERAIRIRLDLNA